MSDTIPPCPVCSAAHRPLDSACFIPWLDQLKASGLYPSARPDLTAHDEATLRRWFTSFLIGDVWPGDFPAPEPDGYRIDWLRYHVTGDGPERPDGAWHAWSEAMCAVIGAMHANGQRAETWRDRPAML